MANTLRHPMLLVNPAVSAERLKARSVGDHPPGRCYKNQYLRRLEKATYRFQANQTVKNYVAGNIDDVLIDRPVHGYID